MLLQNYFNIEDDTDRLRNVFVGAISPLLIGTSVLQTLSKLQRTLDPLDIEGLSRLWNNSSLNKDKSSEFLGLNFTQPSLEEWSNFVDQYFSFGHTLNNGNPDETNLRYYTLAYTLSATFKDSSIMLNVRPENEQRVPVRVIDLDTKDIGRLGRWRALDQEIVEVYGCVKHRKRCIDNYYDV